MYHFICIIKGHKWEAFYRGYNKICSRCNKVVSFYELFKKNKCSEAINKLSEIMEKKLTANKWFNSDFAR